MTVTTARRDIVLSGGFSRFQLTIAAGELDRRGRLALLLTGAYPGARLRDWLNSPAPIPRSAGRLLDRAEQIDDSRVRALWAPELGERVLRPALKQSTAATHFLAVSAMHAYGVAASRELRRLPSGPSIFHYRAGFGHRSIQEASRRGLKLICDHSAVHPALVEYLVDSGGRFPTPEERPQPGRFWASVLGDVRRADAIVVNSDFVKETFVSVGWPASSIHVVYLGIDDAFLDWVPRRTFSATGRMRLLFAGHFNRHKGADELVSALSSLPADSWELAIAGHVSADVHQRHASFLSGATVDCVGTLRRRDLAQLMAASDVFVFPSRAEGSARVVFEALAAGCYVVTTPNAGSIVEPGSHGALVPPGDPESLAAALASALQERAHVAEVGASNMEAVRAKFRQRNYVDGLERIYDALGRSA